MFCRNEEWSGDSDRKNGPSEGEAPMYAGPPGMDPDGVIESNWEVVSKHLRLFYYFQAPGRWIIL